MDKYKEFLVNKTNRCTKFQLYWYYNSTYFGQSFCPSSGVLAVHDIGTFYAVLVAECYQNCVNCTDADVWLELLMMGIKTARNM
jgi:hypothetical protein